MAEVHEGLNEDCACGFQVSTAAPGGTVLGQEVLIDRPLVEVPPATTKTDVCAEKGCKPGVPTARKGARSKVQAHHH